MRDTIAECVEVSIRHICNLLLYNKDTLQFDLSHLEPTIDKGNPFYTNFKNFFNLQPPEKANSGDITIRSEWNKVVADMNAFQDPIQINYMRGNNELNAGYLNLTKLFQKLFNLTLKELPTPTGYKKEEDYHNAQLKWVKDAMLKVFQTMNPNYDYTFELSGVSHVRDDISGVMKIEAKKDDHVIFSFDIQSFVNRHAEITNLTSAPSDEDNYYDTIRRLRQVNTDGLINSAESMVLLINQAGLKLEPKSPFYKLFQKKLQDNTSRIDLLKDIKANLAKWKTDDQYKDHIKVIYSLVEHILEQTSWEDSATVDSITLVLYELLEGQDENLKQIVSKRIKGLDFTNIYKEVSHLEFQTLLNLSQLKYLNLAHIGRTVLVDSNNNPLAESEILLGLSKIKSLKTLSLTNQLNSFSCKQEDFEGLEKLIFSTTKIKTVELENLKSLKLLKVNFGDKLEMLSLKTLKALEEVSLNQSGIKTLELAELNSLKKLDLSWTSNLKNVSLKAFEALEELFIVHSNINTLELVDLNSLRKIRLSFSKELETLSLKALGALEEVDLEGCKIAKIELENLNSLKKLNMSSTSELGTLSLKELRALEEVNLSHSTVKAVEFENLDSLKKVNLYQTSNIKTLKLNKLSSLENLDLNAMVVEQTTLEDLNNLKALNLEHHIAQQSLSLTRLNNLEDLTLKGALTRTVSLNDMNSIETLDFSEMQKLDKLSFSGSFNNLKRINLKDSSELQIEGLNDLMEKKIKSGQKIEVGGLSEENLLRIGIRKARDESKDLQ